MIDRHLPVRSSSRQLSNQPARSSVTKERRLAGGKEGSKGSDGDQARTPQSRGRNASAATNPRLAGAAGGKPNLLTNLMPSGLRSLAARRPKAPSHLAPAPLPAFGLPLTPSASAGQKGSPFDRPAKAAPLPSAMARVALFSTDGQLLALSDERQELICSLIGLTVKLGLVALAGVSLVRLSGAYQQRMERQGEISAVLDLETARLAKARERFDQLFSVEGEQKLIREQSQWIAPNRLRVVWQPTGPALPSVETSPALPKEGTARP